MDKPQLLLVEDEPVTRMTLEVRLQAVGFRVAAVASAEQALALLQVERFAVMVTDLLLESLDGVALMRAARALDPDLEVIVLTGAASMDSAIAAVNHGAHAYLRKPARRGELEERAAAALERRRARIEPRTALQQLRAQLLRIAEPHGPSYSTACDGPARLRVGRLELDPQQRRAAIDRRAVPLSSGEFELLLYMARRDNQVLSAEQLAREVLHCCCSTAEARELVKVRIHRLRRKIERDPRAPAMLVSVRGVGYMLTSTH